MNKIQMLLASAIALTASVSAQAASVIPAGVFTGVTVDAKDTVVDLAVQGLPLLVAITLGWFIFTGARRVLFGSGLK